jgi:hypothetical protein
VAYTSAQTFSDGVVLVTNDACSSTFTGDTSLLAVESGAACGDASSGCTFPDQVCTGAEGADPSTGKCTDGM